jgi:hypothetical protein
MDRDIKSFNRPIMDRINARNHELHIKRLKNIRKGNYFSKSYHKTNYTNITNSNSQMPPNQQQKLPQYNNHKK